MYLAALRCSVCAIVVASGVEQRSRRSGEHGTVRGGCTERDKMCATCLYSLYSGNVMQQCSEQWGGGLLAWLAFLQGAVQSAPLSTDSTADSSETPGGWAAAQATKHVGGSAGLCAITSCCTTPQYVTFGCRSGAQQAARP